MPSKDPEKRKEAWSRWYQKHKEQKSAYDKKRYQEKGEEIREGNHRRYLEKKEERDAYCREYHQIHKDRINKRKRAKRRFEANPADASAFTALHTLQECPRLHYRSVTLPCGQREECFLKPVCDKVPKGAEKPRTKLW